MAGASRGHATPTKVFEFKGKKSFKEFRTQLKAAMSPEEWTAFKSEPLELHSMRQDAFGGEDKPGFVRKGTERRIVDYFRTEKERQPFEVTIKEGKYFMGDKPYDTKGRLVVAVAGPGAKADGPHKMYADNLKVDDLNVKHSSFLAGKSAFFAPEKITKAGVPTYMTNRSGHYRMTRRSFVRYLLHLESQGLDLSQLEIEFDKKSTVE